MKRAAPTLSALFTILCCGGCLPLTKYEDQSYDYYGERNYKVESTYSTSGHPLQNMSEYRQPSAPVSDRTVPPGW